MAYDDFTTFRVETGSGIAWVTFDFPPVNIQGLPMLADLDTLAGALEQDRDIKVVVFQSAHPEIFVAHADTDFLKDMSTSEATREEVELLDLQRTLERISQVPQATIAKIEGFARGGG
ncbi:MAG: enoyl-CoA hydratase/isomerase family protein, partial [Myxococcota bacterium]